MLQKLLTKALDEALHEIMEEEGLDKKDILSHANNGGVTRIQDISLNKAEKEYLTRLAGDETFIAVIDKLIYGISVNAINTVDIGTLREQKGGVRMLQSLKDAATSLSQEVKHDPGTGENKSD